MIVYLIFGVCFLALGIAAFNYFSIKKLGTGTEKMNKIASYIAQGARSFLKEEYKIMLIFIAVISVLIFFFLDSKDTPYNEGLFTAISFICGSIASIVSGAIGMFVATMANVRTTEASRKSIADGFHVAFRGGSVLGLSLVSFAVMGIMFLFLLYNAIGMDTGTTVEVLTGFALGGSMMALFGRVGGGIYTKAADVGADLVGKIEHGIPEDDPRNPAVIADNVGDNVGDVAGMGSDLFGSIAESTCAALVIGAIAFGATKSLPALIFPVLVSVIGIVSSLAVLFFVKAKKNARNVEGPIKFALIGSTALTGILMCFVTLWAMPATFVLNDMSYTSRGILYSLLSGLISGLIIGLATEYYTSTKYGPVKKTVESAKTGPATLIIQGLSIGYESAIIPVVFIAITAVLAFKFAGLYGVAMSAIGMLGTLVIALTIDVYGPISDNAGGIAEMSGIEKEVRKRTDVLDAAGNTTAAIGKGFAIGSAALTALALFSAFVTKAGIHTVNLLDMKVIGGLMIGGVLPFVFSAMTMKSVGKAAQKIVMEVRRQFRDIEGIMKGDKEPDYDKCIAISTQASLREMIMPGVMIIFTPVIVGIFFGVEVLAGVLAGSVASGVVLAVSMANSGGVWDNAKKYIESLEEGGKGSDHHKAAVVGDTVGDPFKDASGPSINILIKLMAITSLVVVPLLI